MTLKGIREIEESLTQISKKLMECREEAVYEATKAGSDISKVYSELIAMIPALKDMGVDIPSDILMAQLQNYTEGCEKKDVMLLTDSISFEILDTVGLFREILEQLQ